MGLPGNFPKFLDLNGNGRRDPGEPRMHIPRIPKEAVRGGGGGGGGPFLNYNDIRAFLRVIMLSGMVLILETWNIHRQELHLVILEVIQISLDFLLILRHGILVV